MNLISKVWGFTTASWHMYKTYIIGIITAVVVIGYKVLTMKNETLKEELENSHKENEVVKREAEGKILQNDIERDAIETVNAIKDVEDVKDFIKPNSDIII